MATIKHGFDLTEFGFDNWVMLVRALNLTYAGNPDNSGHQWRNRGALLMVTANNPATGVYCQPDRRAPELGYASYIGIEGPASSVKKAVRLVRKYAEYIKGEEAGERGYI